MGITLEKLIEEAHSIKNGLIEQNGYYFDYYKLADNSQYEDWHNLSYRFLMANYPDDPFAQKFEETCKKFMHDGCLPTDMDKLIAILKSCIAIPQLPKPSTHVGSHIDKSVHVNVNQNQSQSQKQSLVVDIFLEALKDEIKGKQLKELKAIAQEEPNPEKAKTKVLDKIKSWGGDVLANVVANIVTNPNIWNGLM